MLIFQERKGNGMPNQCKRCQAPVIWVRSVNGKPMILNAKPEKRIVIDRTDPSNPVGIVTDTYTSHFSNCPFANEFRKGKG